MIPKKLLINSMLLGGSILTSIQYIIPYLFNKTLDNTNNNTNVPTPPKDDPEDDFLDDKKSADSKYSFVNQKFLERRKNKDTTETKSIESIGYLEDNLKSIETKYSVVNQDLIDLSNRETTETRLMEIITSADINKNAEQLDKIAHHINCNNECLEALLDTNHLKQSTADYLVLEKSKLINKKIILKK